ncbi:lactate racemase domain-containing protein, partial [Desulfovibrio sp.]|uniref:lactate racemase domain-containing protein n=1 Tax=Desulfovibrio sp. TaxID=885 RepID=UPI0023C6CFF2
MAAHMEFDYGTGTVPFTLPEGIQALTLLPHNMPGLPTPREAVAEALRKPRGSASLLSRLREKKPRSVTVVVNDETRPTPYGGIVARLGTAVAEAGVKG